MRKDIETIDSIFFGGVFGAVFVDRIIHGMELNKKFQVFLTARVPDNPDCQRQHGTKIRHHLWFQTIDLVGHNELQWEPSKKKLKYRHIDGPFFEHRNSFFDNIEFELGMELRQV